ncbi:LptF/LptG family permease [Dysgonomonas sp. Marseille-P4361]|uniref:LptF/LptG family permease n=1 Tax=Dysgonomonas sp. Marseille-P4361 TaxID=2161820 RepID=UPI000D560650|nr:LptF/LptG family permease [Dysgonomonas sp. Marseille-P4361]
MLRIKRLYLFIIQTFVPVFFMTFGICLFIVLMQFLWRYVEEMVGKGLDVLVLGELFFYAALQLIPMALPLSLLLASLMTFGNLGERLELLAIKAAGVSLLKVMRPLIILVGMIAIGAFFFQNYAMPEINVKFRSLFMSVKGKKPELEIPEGAFYDGIKGYSLYIKKKDPKTRMLHDLKIYDLSKGFDNMSIIVCDSGIMHVSEDKTFLLFSLYDGQQFSNGQESDTRRVSSQKNKFISYFRENFKQKDVIIPFNTGFERMDEANLEGTYVSKNILQLEESIDSMNHHLDSLNIRDREVVGKQIYLTYRNTDFYKEKKIALEQKKDSFPDMQFAEAKIPPLDFDSLISTFSQERLSQYLESASSEARNNRVNSYMIEIPQKEFVQKNIRYHLIEWHQKFTLSFACLIFFFIGAPLGAIIRKGGLGMPVVVSVCLFIFYYIINNIGYKFARDGVWEVWQGMWLSSAVLFPLGVFLTYKAMNDSALFNPEAYSRFIRKILFIKTPPALTSEERQNIINRIPDVSEIDVYPELLSSLEDMDSDKLRQVVRDHEKYNLDKEARLAALSILKQRGAELGDIIDQQDRKNIDKIQYFYNINSIYTSIAYLLSVLALFVVKIEDLSWIVYAAYFVLFIRSMIYYQAFYRNIHTRNAMYHVIVIVLLIAFYPITNYLYVKKQMDKDKMGVEIID